MDTSANVPPDHIAHNPATDPVTPVAHSQAHQASDDQASNTTPTNIASGSLSTPDWMLQPWTTFDIVAQREVVALIATNACAPDKVLVISDPRCQDVLDVMREHHASSYWAPQGYVWGLPVTDRLYPSGPFLDTHMPHKFSTIVCLGLTNLDQVLKSSTLLPSWKDRLADNGRLVLELDWLPGDYSWRDVARYYEGEMRALGFSLLAINGCPITLGTLSVANEELEMRSKYTNLAHRFKMLDKDKYKRLCSWFKGGGAMAHQRGIQAATIEQGKKFLYGTFARSTPGDHDFTMA